MRDFQNLEIKCVSTQRFAVNGRYFFQALEKTKTSNVVGFQGLEKNRFSGLEVLTCLLISIPYSPSTIPA